MMEKAEGKTEEKTRGMKIPVRIFMGVCELFGVEEEAEGCQTKENGPGQEMIWWML